MNFYYIFDQDNLLVQLVNETLAIPSEEAMTAETSSCFLIHSDEVHNHYLHEHDPAAVYPSGFAFENMKDLRAYYGQQAFTMASKAYQLNNWRQKHRYCGACGTAFGQMNPDRSMKCLSCGNLLFPQTSNAVITAILKDNKILLAHNRNFPEGLYSLIAGFVEMGESFEEAVHREIYEEVGIRVKNIRYFDNQEWPFPNSTMIGFFAEYESGEIQVDGEEIIHADWFTPDTFPILPGGSSIARRIIETYRESVRSK